MVLDAANLWYSMHPTNSIQPSMLPRRRNLYGTRCSQPAQYNPLRFHGVRTLSTLSWCRNYSMHLRRRNLLWYSMKPTSLVQPFALPWRRNLLWYSMLPTSSIQPSTLPQCRNFSALPRHRKLLWFLLQPTYLVQPSGIPWCRIFYGTRCSQPAQYNPSRFHCVGTLSTLPQCRNCSTLPWILLSYLMQPIYGTRCTQPTGYNLPHPWRRNPFRILDAANQLDTVFHTSTVLELLRFQGIGIFCGTQCNQPAQYNPSHFHNVGTFSILPRCRNCSMLPWHRNLLWYSMQPIYGTQCFQPTRYNPPRFHSVGSFVVLDVANQLKRTLRASLALEPFPHFRGVGTTPCILGVGIFYGT